jgi:DNA-binding XRE family transcriptional regulator
MQHDQIERHTATIAFIEHGVSRNATSDRYSCPMTLMNVTGLSLAKRLRAARLLADLEQAELAELIGVARTTVSNWESGRTEPSATYFVRWANATGQPLEWLAEGVVRPEGFEPPAYCSVADGIGPCRCRHGVWRHADGSCEACYCLGFLETRHDDLVLNPPCPVCGSPLVWGVCVGIHADDLTLAA